jgi:phosphotransferase system enzyme I (PtsP)
MLKTLRRIVQEVNNAYNFAEALQIMVTRIRAAMTAQACSVFLIDGRREQYVLMATDGLNAARVGKLRINFNEGLIGWIAQREEPLNLEDAPNHPNYLYCPQLGEEYYKSFLGVPIIYQRELLGILVVQQEQERRFDETEEAFLITLSAQLGGVIAHAQTNGELNKLLYQSANSREQVLKGTSAVSGIGIGTAVVIYPAADLEAVPDRQAEDIAAEKILLRNAVQAAQQEMQMLKARLAVSLPPAEQALFDVYLKILQSESFIDEILTEINQGQWAQGALRKVIKRHIRHFEALDDDYLRERATDFRDLGRRILSCLQAKQPMLTNYPLEVILVGEEITAATLAEVPQGCLKGIISLRGSVNSHMAILARALNIPTIMNVASLPLQQLDGREVIIDGYNGQIYISPAKRVKRAYLNLLEEQRKFDAKLDDIRNLSAQTLDGCHISLLVNIGLTADAELALTVGAEGVGLYRTEIPFMIRDCFPGEEEQRVIYRQLLKAFSPRKVTMRTLDIGGDKALPYFPIQEENPFLGWRGIRVTLDHPEVFSAQIRAMLRASQGLDNLQIMLPMITGASELTEALYLLWQTYYELVDEGERVNKPQVGVMIEVPSAVYQAQALAEQVDFLSVGSNDLIQYMLAVDRNNARVANLYDGLHPAMLRALVHVVEAAHQAGKPVSICGEMANDPLAVILLIAMGFDALSMNASMLPKIKWLIRHLTLAHTQELLAECLAMDHPLLIRQHLNKALEQTDLYGIILGKRKLRCD